MRTGIECGRDEFADVLGPVRGVEECLRAVIECGVCRVEQHAPDQLADRCAALLAGEHSIEVGCEPGGLCGLAAAL